MYGEGFFSLEGICIKIYPHKAVSFKLSLILTNVHASIKKKKSFKVKKVTSSCKLTFSLVVGNKESHIFLM